MYRNTFCAFPRVYCTAREPWPQFMQVADATHAWAHCGRKKLSPPRASKGPGELHSGESVVRRVERPTTTPPRGGRCGWECFEFEFGLSV